MAKTSSAAKNLQAGDRLYKHGVTVTSVTHNEDGTVTLGYAHTDVTGTWHADRRFHVARKVA